jgi:putative drug exporter of the RND superfamily
MVRSALALDATLVRLLLIPAAMRLLGERNWYLPSWLSWLPDLQVEGHQPPAPAADAPPDDTAPKLPPGAVPVRS